MRHLIKSLFMTLVVTAGAALALLILLNHSFLDERMNAITFWCIVALLVCIWGAFVAEVFQTLSAGRDKPGASPALTEAAALTEAEPEAPFAEAAVEEAADQAEAPPAAQAPPAGESPAPEAGPAAPEQRDR